MAIELRLGEALLLGKGEDGSGGREKPSILADALEAVIGAVYIDVGREAAAELVMRLLGDRIAEAASGPGGQDYKTRLQELSARMFEAVPRYEVDDDGPDHAKRFFARCSVDGAGPGRRRGPVEEAGRAGRRPRRVGAAAERRRVGGTGRCLSSPRSRRSAAASNGRSWASGSSPSR